MNSSDENNLEKKRLDDVAFLLPADEEAVDKTDLDSDDPKPASDGKDWELATFALMLLIILVLPFIYVHGVRFFADKDPLGFWLSGMAPFVAFSLGTSVLTIVLIFQVGLKAVLAIIGHYIFRKPSEFDLENLSKWPAAIAFFGTVMVVGICFGALIAFFSPVPYWPVTLQLGVFCVLTCTPVLVVDLS